MQEESKFERQPHCCPGGHTHGRKTSGPTRRDFLGGVGTAALSCAALSGLSWPALAALRTGSRSAPARRPLRVKPVLVYSTPSRRPQRSWRSWGGIQTQEQANEEVARIEGELNALETAADFPVTFLPVSGIKGVEDVATIGDLADADTLIVYAAGGWMNIFDALRKLEKDTIFFCRHKSGPVYLWYEIISPRYLRQHTDHLAVEGVDDDDVVIDSQDELLWRLRALCGLKNTRNSTIVTIGGPSAWAQPKDVVPELVRNVWGLEIKTVSYEELGGLIQAARADSDAVERARRQAGEYLAAAGTKLETKRDFVDNAFLLTEVFRGLMRKADCRALTINSCMGTIMPLSETTACLPLSLLNDEDYLAFCESDFVVVPSGILMGNITGKPTFLNDPTYPHDGIITLAHCTAPRKMDGERREEARIMTHFESDYGAAPKVEMSTGQVVTNIAPDFESKRWVGLLAEIAEAPFLPICRSQIDVRFTCDSSVLAKRMPGFHWMTGYGDYTREIGYALKRVGIQWDLLT